MTRRRAIALALWATMATAPSCHRSPSTRSPERLRDAWVEALRDDDPARAYALLAPEVQAQVPYEAFEARWRAQKTEREAMAEAARQRPAVHDAPVYGGTTVHDEGRVLRWAKAGGRYYVVDGLPGLPQTATPAQTIRALVTAVRTTDFSAIRALLGDDLAQAIDADWQARVEAMEAALDRPGAIELSPDLGRAELRYEPNRVLTLEQTEQGWRITGLE